MAIYVKNKSNAIVRILMKEIEPNSSIEITPAEIKNFSRYAKQFNLEIVQSDSQPQDKPAVAAPTVDPTPTTAAPTVEPTPTPEASITVEPKVVVSEEKPVFTNVENRYTEGELNGLIKAQLYEICDKNGVSAPQGTKWDLIKFMLENPNIIKV